MVSTVQAQAHTDLCVPYTSAVDNTEMRLIGILISTLFIAMNTKEISSSSRTAFAPTQKVKYHCAKGSSKLDHKPVLSGKSQLLTYKKDKMNSEQHEISWRLKRKTV